LNIEEFEIYEGVFNLLLGSNGCGKTTLLRILSLVDKDYKGELIYRGQKLDKQEDEILKWRRKFSVIWQEPYLYRGSVKKNIGLPLKLRRMDKEEIEEKINNLAAKLNITHLLPKRNNELSGGEKQKVSIARALVTEPEILFIDEPATNLDYKSNQFFNRLFIELVEKGVSILLITHDLYQIKKLANYITLLKEGKVASSGQKEEVLFENELAGNNIIDG
jgi:tungstate transport system ATP-binding protein